LVGTWRVQFFGNRGKSVSFERLKLVLPCGAKRETSEAAAGSRFPVLVYTDFMRTAGTQHDLGHVVHV
jgi:hypothetical protein